MKLRRLLPFLLTVAALAQKPNPAPVKPCEGLSDTATISCLMEQIAPQKSHTEAPRYPCQRWDTVTQKYFTGTCAAKAEEKCMFGNDEDGKCHEGKIVSMQIVLTEKQKNTYPENAWIKSCGPDNHADACYEPGKPVLAASTLQVLVSPILAYADPKTDEKGTTEYHITAEKGWSCVPLSEWNKGSGAEKFALVCTVDRKAAKP